MLFVGSNNLWTKNYLKMVQNAFLNELKFKIFLGEHVARLPAFGNNYWILKLHNSKQDYLAAQYSDAFASCD